VNEDEDFIVDDLLSNLNQKKKKINSKDKGRRGENTVVKTLIARFNKPFSRTIGSGNRGSQVNLTEEAKQIFTGDLICPHSFIFCVEIKHGYHEVLYLLSFLHLLSFYPENIPAYIHHHLYGP
jgi:hypothetical protein